MKKLDELSVFFPAYNEEKNIESTVKEALKILPKVANKWEVIVVNDGSSDKTGSIADALAKSNKNIRAVHHKINRGYGGALKTGFKSSKYSWVAFTDADGQFDFSEISKFINETSNADYILGFRLKRADAIQRKIFTWGWALIARIILGLKVKDYSTGFKLIKKEAFESVLPLVGEEKVTQIEMLVKARKKGYKFVEVGVHHYPRQYGAQTGADIKVVIRSIFDLLRLRKILK